MNFNNLNPKTQFDKLLRRKNEIDSAINKHLSPKNGALDFTAHKLNRERKEVKQQMARLSFRFTPDTIA